MSSEIAIRAVGLGKSYHLYRQPQDRLKQILVGSRHQYYREFWAVRDVSFELERGGTLGIVGRNGSGKSTLLQLVAGTLAASTGSVEVRGRIAPLLELGTGFNPEFTGRENVYLNGALLGLTQEEIGARFESIASFADIGEFIDQPVKVYSSGMYVRLAFAVATAVEPDIFILDEALAVGDARFQLACYERIQRMLERGTTLLFVSHEGNAVKRLCQRAIVLEAGQVAFDGTPNDALNAYSRILFASDAPPPAAPAGTGTETTPAARADAVHAGAETLPKEYRYGSGRGRITSIAVLDADGRPVLLFDTGARITIRCTVEAAEAVARPLFALRIKNDKGVEVYGTNTLFQGQDIEPIEAGARLVVEFTQDMVIMPGTYFLSVSFVALAGEELEPLDRRYDVLELRVTAVDRSFGIANLRTQISVRPA